MKDNAKKERVAAIILTAGKGSRMKAEGLSDAPAKQFMDLLGKPVYRYSVEAFLPFVDELILVTGEADVERVKKEVLPLSPEKIRVIPGGAERWISSLNGLNAVSPDVSYVMVHDAARCLVTPEIIEKSLSEAKLSGAAVTAVPESDTVKCAVRREDGVFVTSTPDRKTLYAVQTPQSFERALLQKAYGAGLAAGSLSEVTDDATVVERYTDHPVTLSEGSPENLKITTNLDLEIAKVILKKRTEGGDGH